MKKFFSAAVFTFILLSFGFFLGAGGGNELFSYTAGNSVSQAEKDSAIRLVKDYISAENEEDIQKVLSYLSTPYTKQTNSIIRKNFENCTVNQQLLEIKLQKIESDKAEVYFVKNLIQKGESPFVNERVTGVHYLVKTGGVWKISETKITGIEKI